MSEKGAEIGVGALGLRAGDEILGILGRFGWISGRKVPVFRNLEEIEKNLVDFRKMIG